LKLRRLPSMQNFISIRQRGYSLDEYPVCHSKVTFFLCFSFFLSFLIMHFVSPVDQFWRPICHMTSFHTRMCFCDFCFYASHFRGHVPPKQLKSGEGWIGIFKLNSQNIKTYMETILHCFQPNFAQRWLPNTLIVDGPNTRTTNPRWRAAAILKKIDKSPYLGNCLIDRHEIWYGDANSLCESYWQGCRGDWISIPISISHTIRKTCGNPHRIPIPTESRNPP